MDRPPRNPATSGGTGRGRSTGFCPVDDGRVQYAPANAPYFAVYRKRSTGLVSGTSPINSSVNRFEFVDGDRV
jgi:hypothetical protein